MYRTGDMVRRWPDGSIEFVGRLDDQVKLRGFRIELGEIESVLREHGAVRDAVAAVRDDGAGDQRLIGYVVVRDGGFSEGDLRRFLESRLPSYMVPSAFAVVPVIPRLPSGKVDRSALPATDQLPAATAGAYAAPSSDTERQIAGAFATLLGREPIGRHDDFFRLGGHSLLAARLIARLRSGLGVEVPLRAVFESPTVAGLAQRVELARLHAATPGRPEERVEIRL
jgi:acyl carrier protein